MIAVEPIHSIMWPPLVALNPSRINTPDDREDSGSKTEVREARNPVTVIRAVNDCFPETLDQVGAAPYQIDKDERHHCDVLVFPNGSDYCGDTAGNPHPPP